MFSFNLKTFSFKYDIKHLDFIINVHQHNFKLSHYDVHLLKLLLTGIINKIKSKNFQVEITSNITHELQLYFNPKQQLIKFISPSGLDHKILYEEVTCLHSFLECLCVSIPIVQPLLETKIHNTSNNENLQKIKVHQNQETQSSINEEPQNIEEEYLKNLSKFEEITNILILSDKEKLTDENIEQLKELMRKYLNMDKLPNVDALRSAIETISDMIRKHLKEETILELPLAIRDPRFSNYIQEINIATNISDKIKKTVTLVFIKELLDTIKIMGGLY